MNHAPERRRILVSAYACSPLWGSEPEVGWQWLVQLAQLHDVVVLTHEYFRSHIEPALLERGLDIEVHYVRVAAFGMHPHRQLNSRLFYLWWQWQVRKEARRVLKAGHIDLIHHLTWGTLRFPCFLGGMGVPLVMGPLGGGEAAPMRLFAGLPLRNRIFDYLRSLSLLWIRVDPLATWGPRRSVLVLCRTKESLKRLPTSVQKRAVIVPDIGSPAVDVSQRKSVEHIHIEAGQADSAACAPFRLLFAGRLLGWKGVVLAVGTVARLAAAGHNVQLDIAGDGPLRFFLARLIEARGLGERVSLLGQIPRAELLQLYAHADLFLFPSLHDAGGTVVLEALSRGLPVVCLDLGGPPNFVDASSGLVVSTRSRSREQVEQALADAIGQVLNEPGRLRRMSLAAAEHARRQSWESLVLRAYSLIHQRMGWAQVGMAPVAGVH